MKIVMMAASICPTLGAPKVFRAFDEALQRTNETDKGVLSLWQLIDRDVSKCSVFDG